MLLKMNHTKNTVKWKWEFKAGPFLKLFPDDLPRIIPKAPVFRLGMKAISNLRIKKSPVL